MTAILDARPREELEPARPRRRPPRRKRERSFALVVIALVVVLFGILSVPPADADDDDIDTISGQNEVCTGGFPVAAGSPLTSNRASDTLWGYNTRNIAVDSSGARVYVHDSLRDRVHMITPSQDRIETIAGNGQSGVSPDATDPLAAQMGAVRAIAAGPNGGVYVASADGSSITLQKFTVGGAIETVGSPLPSSASNLGLAVDRNGVAYIAAGSKLFRVSAGGQTTELGVSGLQNPEGAAVDAAGHLYISNTGQNSIIRLDLDAGTATTIATELLDPKGIAVSASGDRLFVAEYNDGNGDGQVTMIRQPAGSPKEDVVVNKSSAAGPGLDGVDAISSALAGPRGVATNASGQSLFVMDSDACALRYVKAVPDPAPPTTETPTSSPTSAPPSSTPSATTPPDGATASEPGPLQAPTAEQAAAPVDEVSPGVGAETSPSVTGDFDFTSEFFFGGAGTPSDFSSFFSFTPGDAGSFSGAQGFSFSADPSAQAGAQLTAPPQGAATNNPAIVAVNPPAPAQAGPVGVSAMPPPGAAPGGANAGLVSAGVRPADPAARYAMVARDDEDAFPLGLAALGVVMAGSGCVLLASASRGRATPRPRPARARAY